VDRCSEWAISASRRALDLGLVRAVGSPDWDGRTFLGVTQDDELVMVVCLNGGPCAGLVEHFLLRQAGDPSAPSVIPVHCASWRKQVVEIAGQRVVRAPSGQTPPCYPLHNTLNREP